MKKKGQEVKEIGIGKIAVAVVVIPFMIMMAIVFRHGYSEEQEQQHKDEFLTGSRIEEIDDSEETIEDLVILGKVWGYLKYYHPVVRQGMYNWDFELFRFLPDYLEAESKTERDELLSLWITELGEFPPGEPGNGIEGEVVAEPNLSWIDESGLSEELVEQLREIERAERIERNAYVDLHYKIYYPIIRRENPYSFRPHPDTGYRLLAVYRYWNLIEYYSPYRYVLDEDWGNVLEEFIPKFITAENEKEYKLGTLELMARVRDTNANIRSSEHTIDRFWGRLYGPLEITFVEEQAVVTGYHDTDFGEATGVEVGDIITKVDGKSVETIIEEKKKFIPASNHAVILREIAEKLLRTGDDTLPIEFRRGDTLETTEIQSYTYREMTVKDRGRRDLPPLQRIEDGIAYLYAASIGPRDLEDIIPEALESEGLIIDLRSFSRDLSESLGKYLMPETTGFASFSHGSLTTPGLFKIGHTLEVGQENQDYYKGNVVILVNELTEGRAEYTAMALRVAPNATVIGSMTAGGAGTAGPFEQPAQIETAMSGIGIYDLEGNETQRVGVVPDIEVLPTIEGIRAGRDEVLEKALELIQQ